MFWKDDPTGPPPGGHQDGGVLPPRGGGTEKEGSLTNTQRMLQWHNKALDPLGDSRSDAWFLYDLGKRLKNLYAGSTDPRDQPLLNLTWDYDYHEHPRLPDGTVSRIEGEPDLEKVLQEINGYQVGSAMPAEEKRPAQPALLKGFGDLKDDGTTACGCWIYSGVFPEPGRNRSRERKLTDNPVQPEWGYAWPLNRRVLYNRGFCRPRRAAVVGAQEARVVGRDSTPVDGLRRARLRAGQGA